VLREESQGFPLCVSVSEAEENSGVGTVSYCCSCELSLSVSQVVWCKPCVIGRCLVGDTAALCKP